MAKAKTDSAREILVQNLELERLQQEIKSGFKSLQYENKTYLIHVPKLREERMILDYKSGLTTKLLADDGKMTKDEVMNSLKKRGIWSDEKERRLQSLRDETSNIFKDIFIENSKSKPNEKNLDTLNKKRVDVELEIAILTDSLSKYLDATIESEMERDINRYKMVILITDEFNQPIWNSLEDLDNDPDRGRINFLISAGMYFWAGLDPALFEVAPRNEISGGDTNESSEESLEVANGN